LRAVFQLSDGSLGQLFGDHQSISESATRPTMGELAVFSSSDLVLVKSLLAHWKFHEQRYMNTCTSLRLTGDAHVDGTKFRCFMCRGNSARVPDSSLCYFSCVHKYIGTTIRPARRRNDRAVELAKLWTVKARTKKIGSQIKHQQHHAWYVWRSVNSTSAFALTRKFKKQGKVEFREHAAMLMRPSSSRQKSCA
jgi:hypothetical protein